MGTSPTLADVKRYLEKYGLPSAQFKSYVELGTSIHQDIEKMRMDERLKGIVSFVNRHNGCPDGIEIMEDTNGDDDEDLLLCCHSCAARLDESHENIECYHSITCSLEWASILADRLDNGNSLRAGGS